MCPEIILPGNGIILLSLVSETVRYSFLTAYGITKHIIFIMVISPGILAVGADQSQSTDIADDVAAVVLLCYDFPVFIIEELH